MGRLCECKVNDNPANDYLVNDNVAIERAYELTLSAERHIRIYGLRIFSTGTDSPVNLAS
jgi:hypothetical protein